MAADWPTSFSLTPSGVCGNAFPDKSGPTEPSAREAAMSLDMKVVPVDWYFAAEHIGKLPSEADL